MSQVQTAWKVYEARLARKTHPDFVANALRIAQTMEREAAEAARGLDRGMNWS